MIALVLAGFAYAVLCVVMRVRERRAQAARTAQARYLAALQQEQTRKLYRTRGGAL